ncbi:MAG: helix-turn-helix domain-containing protein [Bergeyella sp.]
MKNNQPNYKAIYTDILCTKFPDKMPECFSLLRKKELSVIDIIELNVKIFGIQDKETFEANQKHRSYGESDIIQILNYQKKNQLNNIELARHFKLSRNTVAKWKKMFL